MSTPNFDAMDMFELYVHSDSEFYLKRCPNCNLIQGKENEVCEECGCELGEAEFEPYVVFEFLAEVHSELEKVNENLKYFNIELRDGYFADSQFYVKITSDADNAGFSESVYYSDPDNWACNHYLGVCRSIAIREHDAEVNRINKKILPALAKKFGFEHIRCVGVFNNGEGVYEPVYDKTV